MYTTLTVTTSPVSTDLRISLQTNSLKNDVVNIDTGEYDPASVVFAIAVAVLFPIPGLCIWPCIVQRKRRAAFGPPNVPVNCFLSFNKQSGQLSCSTQFVNASMNTQNFYHASSIAQFIAGPAGNGHNCCFMKLTSGVTLKLPMTDLLNPNDLHALVSQLNADICQVKMSQLNAPIHMSGMNSANVPMPNIPVYEFPGASAPYAP
ncbi:hypothetical protein RCL1_004968 [Eukaryota sp. TZLM3-RCL]